MQANLDILVDRTVCREQTQLTGDVLLREGRYSPIEVVVRSLADVLHEHIEIAFGAHQEPFLVGEEAGAGGVAGVAAHEERRVEL
eukprot:373019-Rhodomonas_salina.1